MIGFMAEVSVARMEGPVALRAAERERWRSVTTFLWERKRNISYHCLRLRRTGIGERE